MQAAVKKARVAEMKAITLGVGAWRFECHSKHYQGGWLGGAVGSAVICQRGKKLGFGVVILIYYGALGSPPQALPAAGVFFLFPYLTDLPDLPYLCISPGLGNLVALP